MFQTFFSKPAPLTRAASERIRKASATSTLAGDEKDVFTQFSQYGSRAHLGQQEQEPRLVGDGAEVGAGAKISRRGNRIIRSSRSRTWLLAMVVSNDAALIQCQEIERGPCPALRTQKVTILCHTSVLRPPVPPQTTQVLRQSPGQGEEL